MGHRSGPIIVEKVGAHISLIKLNRPERLNALSFELVSELCDALRSVARDHGTWVAILTGEGRGFCSGLDLENPGEIPDVEGMPLARVGMVAMSHFSQVVPALRALTRADQATAGCAELTEAVSAGSNRLPLW